MRLSVLNFILSEKGSVDDHLGRGCTIGLQKSGLGDSQKMVGKRRPRFLSLVHSWEPRSFSGRRLGKADWEASHGDRFKGRGMPRVDMNQGKLLAGKASSFMLTHTPRVNLRGQ